MDNTSLDDFLDGGSDTGASGDESGGTDSSRGGHGGDESTGEDTVDAGDRGRDSGGSVGAVEPPTSRWHADGAACAACGDRVTRCWRESGHLVCSDCKGWDRA